MGEDYDDSLCHYATGYAGVVTRFIESSVAELRFSVSGCMQYAALDRCRLYINGCLCSNRKSIQSYISVGDTVNFDAAKAHPRVGINFRIVTGWVGKMTREERIYANGLRDL
ncbi:Hypothetical predicted protein [Cloeon dipterum]|uniref:Uncharacterized protein n=1 Tax=Cloeon dipterum TaxID=197152 RepID=A0A8S1C3U4_9INSE|nr:Hypothetical predicted protein [Cloeon dipterum]